MKQVISFVKQTIEYQTLKKVEIDGDASGLKRNVATSKAMLAGWRKHAKNRLRIQPE